MREKTIPTKPTKSFHSSWAPKWVEVEVFLGFPKRGCQTPPDEVKQITGFLGLALQSALILLSKQRGESTNGLSRRRELGMGLCSPCARWPRFAMTRHFPRRLSAAPDRSISRVRESDPEADPLPPLREY